MMRWKGICAYDGTDLSGWQSQPGGNTVQDLLERRLAQVFTRPVRIHGSGRTDAGVHAEHHPFHFDADWPHGADTLLRAFRSNLPKSIQVWHIEEISDDFHARFSARGKRYAYRIFEGFPRPWEDHYTWALGNRRLDVAALVEAALCLVGTHDFSSLAVNRGDGSAEDSVKTLWRVAVEADFPRLQIVCEGSGFLYKMVRSIAGTLVEVGLGKLSPARLAELLAARQRSNEIAVAPAKGLWLEEVFY